MTRPTRGREVTPSPPGQRSSFPAALASALERTAGRDRHRTAQPDTGRFAQVGRSVSAVGAADAAGEADPGGATAVSGGGAGPGAVTALVQEPSPAGSSPVSTPAVRRPSSGVAAPGVGPGVAPLAPGAPAPWTVVVGDGTGDTPEPGAVHLIEAVGPEAMPIWVAYLDRRDRPSRERLLEHYGSLVRGVATKLAVRLPASIELADLVQSGTFGLMDAVDRFDPARAVRFDGYAAQRVRGAMLDELRAQDWVPRSVRARSREVERARETLRSRTGRPPTDRELASELGTGLRELRHAVRPVHLVSVETLEQTGDGGVGELVVDDTVPDPVLVAVRRETRRELEAAVAQLGERDRRVLRLYYLENRTLAEIGGLLGVTESRVCQLHSRIVSRLRGRLEPLQAC